MEFYVTLPSNVFVKGSVDTNTNSNYVTRLAKPLTLSSGSWEVGLVDIHFPSSWKNITNSSIKLKEEGRAEIIEVALRRGRYTSFSELLLELQRALKTYTFDEFIGFYYDSVRNKIFVKIGRPKTSLMFSVELCRIMGFSPDTWLGEGSHASTSSPDIDGGFASLYVYSSVAKPRLVGDTQAPLLRVVSATDKPSFSNIYHEFVNIHYIPVPNIDTDLVEVDIRRDDGQSVSFTSGKVVLTVHFRKSR